MPGHDIIVIGTSAGGVEALSTLVRMLPSDLPAAVFIVIHVPAQSPNLLPDILNRQGPLPVSHPLCRCCLWTACDWCILTGSLDDGTSGMMVIKRRGGMTIVQDPKEATYPSLPKSVIAHTRVDKCLSLEQIGHILPVLATQETQQLLEQRGTS